MTAQDPQVNAIAITELPLLSSHQIDLIVIGGGPAGFMGAITAAENGLDSVCVLESTAKTLEKVRISGGGRCNVTHECWEPNELVTNYPRGHLPLLGSFSRFATGDVVDWFKRKGLELITEEDGRMFPVSNSSFEVVSCLRNAAVAAGVNCFTKSSVIRVEYLPEKGFLVYLQDSQILETQRVLVATGGHPSGRKIASCLGHTVFMPVPSLFSLSLEENFLKNCSGLSLKNVRLKLLSGGKSFYQTGPVLITHWGLSGPAILKLSAFAAHELNKDTYKARLQVNWINESSDFVNDLFKKFRYKAARSTLANAKPFKELPTRLWRILLQQSRINIDIRWSDVSSLQQQRLCNNLLFNYYSVCGRGPYGEEFVTAGGVKLAEVNFATMESRLLPGLYFAGEILDVDGVTGGFNFQHCWTSGWLAGRAIANSCCN
nr:NAD(P)/FAD-dependent oxidoreductase [Prochlorococcus sp. MIT 1307]